MKYIFRKSVGGLVEFWVQNSIIVWIGSILSGLIGVMMLVISFATYSQDGFPLTIVGLFFLVNSAVLSHLKHKAEMNADKVAINSTRGLVEIERERSIWISLMQYMMIIGMLFSILIIVNDFFSVYDSSALTSQGNLLSYVGILVLFGVYIKILGFLKTKLNIKGSSFSATTVNGEIVQFYRDRSVWLILSSIILGIIGLILIIIPVISYYNRLHFLEEYIYIEDQASSIALIFTGIFLLIASKVTSFLSVKLMIRQEGNAGKISSGDSGSKGTPVPKDSKGFFKGKTWGSFPETSRDYDYLGPDPIGFDDED